MVGYDLAAEKTVDTIIGDVWKAYSFARRPLLINGKYPRGDAAMRMVRSIGIVRDIGLKEDQLAADSQLQTFFYRSYTNELPVLSSPDSTSRKIVEFVDHFNGCLSRIKRQLTLEGRERLTSYVSEIIGNAEEHAGRGDWLVAGYLDMSSDERWCEIAVISFGNTFAETFQALRADSYPRVQIEPLIRAHTSEGKFSKTWKEENLLAIVALQSGVSSRNASSASTRGQGTIELEPISKFIFITC